MISSLGKYSNWQVRLDQSVQLVLVLRCAVERTQAGVTVVVFIRELLLQLQSQSSLGRQLRFDGGGGGRLAVRLGRHQRLEVRGDAGGGGAGGAGAEIKLWLPRLRNINISSYRVWSGRLGWTWSGSRGRQEEGEEFRSILNRN